MLMVVGRANNVEPMARTSDAVTPTMSCRHPGPAWLESEFFIAGFVHQQQSDPVADVECAPAASVPFKANVKSRHHPVAVHAFIADMHVVVLVTPDTNNLPRNECQ